MFIALLSRSTRLRLFACLLLLTGLFAADAGRVPVLAQQPDSLAQTRQMYRVETTKGEVVIGPLRSKNDTEVVLESRQFGEVTIARSAIEHMEKVSTDRFRNGEHWFPNPQSTRYFFATNALGISGGEGYYQNTLVLFSNLNYGVSDQFSIGVGTVPVFLFGAPALPFWILPKVSLSFPQTSLHLGGGAMLGGVLGPPWVSTEVGLLYGSGTVGNQNHNVTFSLGYGYSEDDIFNAPVINVSGMTRIGRTTYLLSENYVFPGAGGKSVISLGVRWAPKRFAVDVGFFRPLWRDVVSVVGYPWLGVTLPFDL